jgi:hypothetical protein
MSVLTNPLLRGLLSRIFSISRRAWIFLSITFFIFLALAIWATFSAAGWLFGITRDGVNAAPDAVRAVTTQVEQVIPGVQEKLGVFLPTLKPEPSPREVSGTDPGPVSRFPGLARVQWQRDDQKIQVRYEGPADFAGVLKHYAEQFSALGYQQNLLSASINEERHEYVKDSERFSLFFAIRNREIVSVDLSAWQLEKSLPRPGLAVKPGASF